MAPLTEIMTHRQHQGSGIISDNIRKRRTTADRWHSPMTTTRRQTSRPCSGSTPETPRQSATWPPSKLDTTSRSRRSARPCRRCLPRDSPSLSVKLPTFGAEQIQEGEGRQCGLSGRHLSYNCSSTGHAPPLRSSLVADPIPRRQPIVTTSLYAAARGLPSPINRWSTHRDHRLLMIAGTDTFSPAPPLAARLPLIFSGDAIAVSTPRKSSRR